jgi:glycosyltransferase involved in cell wall biosynthesis
MRVLHLAPGNLFGGIENFLVTLARYRHLTPAIEPCFGLCFPGRLRDELAAERVPIYDLGPVRMSRPWTIWRARAALARVLREPIDVVATHGCWMHALLGSVVRQTPARLIYWVHNLLSGRHWHERWAAWTQPDGVIANSRCSLQASRLVFSRGPGQVIYLPVPQTTRIASPTAPTRHDLNTPPNAVVIICASRLEAGKGHAILLQALRQLLPLPDWACWMLGGVQQSDEVAYLQHLHTLAAPLGARVQFLGQRTDVPHLLTLADLLCQPNVTPESFGLAFVEALAVGRPVVTSGIGGALEIVDASCGILTPPGDVARLASALRRLIMDADERRRLGAAGPARAAELCAVERQMTQIAGALQSLGR